MLYALAKAVHIAAVVLFLGNIITAVFWKRHADGSHDPRIIAHALAGIIRADRWFTIPGVIMIVVAGVATAELGHLPILGTPWILEALILFGISGAVFGIWLAPLQKQLYALANEAAQGHDMNWERYRDLSKRWMVWGTLATATPLAAMVIMVLKPG
ncbi:MAG TPA: DUF2269 family protein [Gammaproteobacteria bacterium]|nr:DUF2269 family protein [Gammaproteobacteria bacterium]